MARTDSRAHRRRLLIRLRRGAEATTSAHHVADELQRRLGDLGKAKLHKMLYYAAGWHAAWTGEQLFGEPIEAWLNGPVVAKLWADQKYRRRRPEAQRLTDRQLATIDYVVDRYGTLSGQELIRMTHEEDPWLHVSQAEVPVEVGGSKVISVEAMRAWFQHHEDYVRYHAEVARLRERIGDDPFALPPRTPDLNSAIERTIAGERVRQQRPM